MVLLNFVIVKRIIARCFWAQSCSLHLRVGLHVGTPGLGRAQFPSSARVGLST